MLGNLRPHVLLMVLIGWAVTFNSAALAQQQNTNRNSGERREVQRTPRDQSGNAQQQQRGNRDNADPRTRGRDSDRRDNDRRDDDRRNWNDDGDVRVRRGTNPQQGGGEERVIRSQGGRDRGTILRRGDARNDRLFERRDRGRTRVETVPSRTVVQRGTVVRELPRGHERVMIRNQPYYRAGNVYYTEVRSGPVVQYRVVPPPIGAYVTYVPDQSERIVYGGVQYYRADGVYYLPTLYQGRTRFVVVEPPIGAELYELPGQGEWFTTSTGDRLLRIGEMIFRSIVRNGRNAYVRVHYVPPAPTVVYGTISYRGRLALPSDAVVTVQLVDVRQGPQGAVIAEQSIQNPGPPPIPYTLRFDGGRVSHGQQYGLAAAITANGRMLYATLRPHPFAVGGSQNNIDLILDPARDRPEPQPARVTGRLVLAQRVAMPHNAEIVVRLIDVNNPSGQEIVLAEQVFYPPGGGAMPFELRYDPNEIDPLGIYIVEARVRVGDNAIFYNPQEYRVITRGYPDDLEILLEPIR